VRLILSLLFAGVLLAIPAVLLADAVLDRENRDETAADRLGSPFVWPERPQAADPVLALRILTEAATATGSTVVRTTVNTTASTRKRITHYVLVGGDRTAFFNEFTLAEGRWLSPPESRDGQVTVSSARADEPGNVGVPAVFGGRYELAFAPLSRAFTALPSSGRYVVEARDPATTERFLALVGRGLAEAGVTGLTVADLTPELDGTPAGTPPSLTILAYVLAGIATVVVAFVLVREGKRIGVLRLVGHPATRIWYEVAGRLQAGSALVGTTVWTIVVLAVPGADALSLRGLAVTFLEVAAAGFAATLGTGLVLIHRVHISDLVKGRLQ
jgi:hypothetical protein